MKKAAIYILLGLISTIFPFTALIVLYFQLFLFFKDTPNVYNSNGFFRALGICSLEFWGRLTDMDPFFPYEFGKYFLIIYFVLYILRRKIKINQISQLILAINFIYSLVGYLEGVSLNLVLSESLGITVIILGGSILNNLKVVNIKTRIFDVLGNWVLFLLPSLSYLFIKTPNIEQMEFNLGSNYFATGGESANQVSTYLGFGAFVLTILIFNFQYVTGNLWSDLIILVLFVFQSILTFSRGGLIVYVVLIVIYILRRTTSRNVKYLTLIFSISGLVIIGLFDYVNSSSNGKLIQRYRGETDATLKGLKEKNLNVITSNRLEIIELNFEIFKKNLLGLGVSRSTDFRFKEHGKYYRDHTELSRWVVEYGLSSIIIFIWLVNLIKVNGSLLLSNARQKIPLYDLKVLIGLLFFMALLTMLHNATRTIVSIVPMIFGMLNLNVYTFYRRNKSPQKA